MTSGSIENAGIDRYTVAINMQVSNEISVRALMVMQLKPTGSHPARVARQKLSLCYSLPVMSLLEHAKVLLRGISEVFLVNNALTGLLILCAIGIDSWKLAMCTLSATIVSTLTAGALDANRDDIKIGLYGFNGALVGVAAGFYFGVTLQGCIAIVAASALSSFLMMQMKKSIKQFTAPFIISVWTLLAVSATTNILDRAPLPSLPTGKLNIFLAVPRGVGQVMFQGNVYVGLIFVTALIVGDRTRGIFAVYGSFMGVVTAIIISAPHSPIAGGLFGFNAVLCAIVFGDFSKKSFLFATFVSIATTAMYYGLIQTPIISLTAPFVITTWIILGFQKKLFTHAPIE